MSQRKPVPAAMTTRKKAIQPVTAAMTVSRSHNLSAEQYAALVERVLGPERDCLALYNAPEFKTLMQKFSDVVARDGGIDQEQVKYAEKGQFPFTAEEFRNAFAAVMKHAPGEQQHGRSKSGIFPTHTKIYKGMEFFVIEGQGSSYSVSAAEKGAPKP